MYNSQSNSNFPLKQYYQLISVTEMLCSILGTDWMLEYYVIRRAITREAKIFFYSFCTKPVQTTLTMLCVAYKNSVK